MIKLTIGIPVYEMNDNGIYYLDKLLNNLKEQTEYPNEIIISDNSIDNKINDFINNYKSRLSIRYVKNLGVKHPCNNLNNIINNASGDYIKFIFQDDFPYSKKLIKKTIEAINKNPNSNWFVCGSNNFNNKVYFNEIIPSYNKDIYKGKNTIGSPSVLTIKNTKDKIFFDNRFVWLLDCVYYYHLYNRVGPPTILKEVLISNRVHQQQLTEKLKDSQKLKEILFSISLHENFPKKILSKLRILIFHFARKFFKK